MSPSTDPLRRIQGLVAKGAYRVRLHAVRHMIEEGFDERQMLEALGGKLTLVEAYPDESRYLVLGNFRFTPKSRSPLHVLCDVSLKDAVDIVTAYIPQRPWWTSPKQRGRGRKK
jgi:hypothetical protein